MLYNPNWEPRKAPKPWTLDHLIQWLETKEGRYSYSDGENCMIAQYAKEMGYKGVRVTSDVMYYRPLGGLSPIKIWMKLPQHFNYIAYASDRTFKGALKVAKEIRTSVSPAPQSQGRPVASSELLERTA